MAVKLNIPRQITSCARCGQDHAEIVFKQLTHPVQLFEDSRVRNAAFFRTPSAQMYTHWAPCPTNGEPILMRMITRPPSCCVGGVCRSRAPGHRNYQPGQPVTQEQLDNLTAQTPPEQTAPAN